MIWLFYSAAAAFLWAIVNHIDKHLIVKYCRGTEAGSLLIFSSLIGIPGAILIALFSTSVFEISSTNILLLIIAGMLYIFGLIPYMYALGEDETSNVAPLFLMAPIFSLILAWVILGEKMLINQIFGIFLILFGAGWLSVETEGKVGFRKKTFFLMALTSFSVALNALLFKYGSLDNVSFWTLVFWEYIGFIISGIVLLVFYKPYREQFKLMIKENTVGVLGLNLTNETLTIFGNLAFHYATLLTFIAVVETVTEGFHPIFILVFGILLTKFFPNLGNEDISNKKLLQKLASMVTMLVGLSIINFGFTI
jgi:uncharacterized membrane protein